MYKFMKQIILLSATLLSLNLHAQERVQANFNHKALLSSDDPLLAANKQLVYNFWREVFEAGHMELAPKYMSENYIQHNPNVATGRKAFIDFFSALKKPQPIADRINAPLVNIVAEGDIVILSFVREKPDPTKKGATYTTTWFDMFRIEDGKITEHWDPMMK